MKPHHLGLAAALACAATCAHAHDTWFEPLPAANGEPLLALGTGNQYPRYDSGIGREYLARQGCRVSSPRGETHRVPLQPLRNEPASLVLKAPQRAQGCWAQLTPFEVDMPPEKVAIYFKDIQPPPAVREAWIDMQRRGVKWHERYTKHARIEFGTVGAAPTAATDMGMDIRIESDGGALKPGATLVAQVLRDGQPLPGQAIELRSESSPIGIWRRTDTQGRLSVPVPLPGRWVLRGTDLRLSEQLADQWESRFVTLAFEVQPVAPVSAAPSAGLPADQNGSHLTLNALSMNQTAATTAITSDPPVSTARR